jgi:hypothetical protein
MFEMFNFDVDEVTPLEVASWKGLFSVMQEVHVQFLVYETFNL